jgi:hypothetical protein
VIRRRLSKTLRNLDDSADSERDQLTIMKNMTQLVFENSNQLHSLMLAVKLFAGKMATNLKVKKEMCKHEDERGQEREHESENDLRAIRNPRESCSWVDVYYEDFIEGKSSREQALRTLCDALHLTCSDDYINAVHEIVSSFHASHSLDKVQWRKLPFDVLNRDVAANELFARYFKPVNIGV